MKHVWVLMLMGLHLSTNWENANATEILNRVMMEPTPLERCKFADSLSVPIVTPSIISIANNIDPGNIPKDGVLVCKTGENTPAAQSRIFTALHGGDLIFVIWINANVLENASQDILRFVFAHELSHYILRTGACNEQDLLDYLPCEHRVDQHASSLVGKHVAKKGLAFFHERLIRRHAYQEDIDLLMIRRSMLK